MMDRKQKGMRVLLRMILQKMLKQWEIKGKNQGIHGHSRQPDQHLGYQLSLKDHILLNQKGVGMISMGLKKIKKKL